MGETRGRGEQGSHGATYLSAYVSIRQHTSAYVSIRRQTRGRGEQGSQGATYLHVSIRQQTAEYVSIRQHTSAYVSRRGGERGAQGSEGATYLRTYVSIRQHTSAYVYVLAHIHPALARLLHLLLLSALFGTRTLLSCHLRLPLSLTRPLPPPPQLLCDAYTAV